MIKKSLMAAISFLTVCASVAQMPASGSTELMRMPDSSASFRLTGQFPGPFQDTLIQRWQDASNGATCYLYIPVMVPWVSQQAGQPGLPPIRQYGSNQLGSISCISTPINSQVSGAAIKSGR